MWDNFSIVGIGIPPAHILLQDLPMAIICYVIAFGDIVGGTAFMETPSATVRMRRSTSTPTAPTLCCGVRNLIEPSSSPPAPCPAPCGAMTVYVAERYKTGKDNMYSTLRRAAPST